MRPYSIALLTDGMRLGLMSDRSLNEAAVSRSYRNGIPVVADISEIGDRVSNYAGLSELQS